MELMGVKAHDVTAFAASKAFYGGASMDQIMQACYWKSHNTFTKFYLKDLSGQDKKEGSYHLGSFVAAQQVVPPFNLAPGKKTGGGGGALLREPFRRGVSESSDTIERGLHPFKVTIFFFSLLLPAVFSLLFTCYQEYFFVSNCLRMYLSFTFSVFLILLFLRLFLCCLMFLDTSFFIILCVLWFFSFAALKCLRCQCDPRRLLLPLVTHPNLRGTPLSLDMPFLNLIVAPSSTLVSGCSSW